MAAVLHDHTEVGMRKGGAARWPDAYEGWQCCKSMQCEEMARWYCRRVPMRERDGGAVLQGKSKWQVRRIAKGRSPTAGRRWKGWYCKVKVNGRVGSIAKRC